MSIIIKRNTGWIGSFTKIQIRLNGEKVASVMKNQQIEIELPNNKVNIKATQYGTKSNEIEVKDGDILEITTTKWCQIVNPIFIVAILLINFIQDFRYRTLAFIPLFVYIISLLIIDGFYLKVFNQDQ